MIRFRFGPEDVANLRFGISPLMELHSSVRTLDHPEARSLHLPWVAATRERVEDLDITVLRALQRRRAWTPDFTSPPPSTPLADLDAELEAMLATPADRVRAEVRRTYAPAPLPPPPGPGRGPPPPPPGRRPRPRCGLGGGPRRPRSPPSPNLRGRTGSGLWRPTG